MKCIQESSEVSQGYSSSERCRFVGGVMKQSIECRLYLWILKSYQCVTRIGSERDSRPKHITAWTKNVAEKFCMCLHLSVCVRLCQCVSTSACVCAQKIKRLDASRWKKFLQPDQSFVQRLSGCTIFMATYSRRQ